MHLKSHTKETFMDSLGFPLSEEELSIYRKDGFIGPFDLISEDEMTDLRKQIESEVIYPSLNNNERLFFHDRHFDIKNVLNLCRKPEIIDRTASLLGPDLLLWRSNFQIKRPASNRPGTNFETSEVPWHQDRTYFTRTLYPTLTVSVWIAISEATPKNGCLQFLRSSDNKIIQHKSDLNRKTFRQSLKLKKNQTDKICTLEMKPGQFVLFHENTIHRSNKNLTTSDRIALTLRITVPFVHIAGNPSGAGRDRSYHAPNELREVVLLRGQDYTGKQRIITSE